MKGLIALPETNIEPGWDISRMFKSSHQNDSAVSLASVALVVAV